MRRSDRHPARATWGARCGKSARRVLRGGTGTSGLTARLVPTHHRVNQDRLRKSVALRIADQRVLRLIGAFLKAGVMENGLVSPVDEGTRALYTKGNLGRRVTATRRFEAGPKGSECCDEW